MGLHLVKIPLWGGLCRITHFGSTAHSLFTTQRSNNWNYFDVLPCKLQWWANGWKMIYCYIVEKTLQSYMLGKLCKAGNVWHVLLLQYFLFNFWSNSATTGLVGGTSSRLTWYLSCWICDIGHSFWVLLSFFSGGTSITTPDFHFL